MPLQKIRKKGSWYQVKDFEGDMHWVYQALVTSQFRCAIIKVDKANLRTGPGTGFPKAADLPVAEKYMSFQLLKVKKGWAQIKDTYNGKYWVFRKLIWVN